jgi:hypothetical protein
LGLRGARESENGEHYIIRSLMIWGNLRERDHLENSGIEGRIILRWMFRTWDVRACDWIDVAENRDRRRALVNAVMNLWVP